MAPNSGTSKSLMSPEAIDAALVRSMNQTNSEGLPVPPMWRDMLHMVDLKQKMQLLSVTPAFEEMLKTASPEQVREMVDAGMFKVVCRFLGGFPAGSVGPDFDAIAMCTDRLTTFIQTLPELALEAWSLGAVRPITELVTRERNLKAPQLLRDEALRAALGFLVAMGKPWQDHLHKPSSQKEAKRASGKLYRWMLKEGIIDAVVKIWCALPDFSTQEKERSYYQQLCYNCAGVLWYATLVQIEKPELAAKSELLKPIFYYLLEEPLLMAGTRAMCLTLLLKLWLFETPDDESSKVANIRRRIARHKDVWKIVDLLKPSVDDPHREPQLANPYQIVQYSFVGLLNLLAEPSARALPLPCLETLCHLLGDIPDRAWFIEAHELVSEAFDDGALSEDSLLTHAYPHFLRGFVAHASRCGYATSSPPGQVTHDPEEMKLLSAMLAFLAGAVRVSLLDGLWRQTGGTDLETAGPSLNRQTLPRFVKLMVSTRAADALAALSGYPFYPRVNMLCAATAESVSKNARVLRALLDQMVRAIVLKMYEDSDAPHALCIERAIMLRTVTRVPRAADRPSMELDPVPCRPGFGKRHVSYNYDNNFASVSADVMSGTHHLVAEVWKEIDEGPSEESRMAQIEEKMQKTKLFAKEAECEGCGMKGVALKRCSRCKGVGYCGTECQREDWPTHKKGCRQRP